MIFCFLHCCWPLHCPKVHSLIITIVIKSRICAFRQGLEKLGDSMDIYNQPFMRLHLHKAILIPWKGDTSTRVDCLIIILTWWHCDGIICFLIMLSNEFWFCQLKSAYNSLHPNNICILLDWREHMIVTISVNRKHYDEYMKSVLIWLLQVTKQYWSQYPPPYVGCDCNTDKIDLDISTEVYPTNMFKMWLGLLMMYQLGVRI